MSRALVHHERSLHVSDFRSARRKAGLSGRANHARMVWAVVPPQLCRAFAKRQACFCSVQDQAGGQGGVVGYRSIPFQQQIVPRSHRASARQGRQPHSLLESSCPGNPIHGRDGTRNHFEPRTPPSIASGTGARLGGLPAQLSWQAESAGAVGCSYTFPPSIDLDFRAGPDYTG